MTIEIRNITADEVPAFHETLARAFGNDPIEQDGGAEHFAGLLEIDRTYTPFDGEQMVGVAAAFTFNVSLPGGTAAPMGGLTMVGVKATHRRRGLLRGMIIRHLEDCRERGEPLSGLWASESSIYGRFGYGDAAPVHDIKIDGPNVGMPPPPDPARILSDAEARTVLPALYDELWRDRPGRMSRTEHWWEHSRFHDPEQWRRGASRRRHVAVFRDGRPVGYAAYRQKPQWDDAVADGKVMVLELLGADGDARLSLWSLLCSIDLFPNVEAENQPPDMELVWQVTNPRLIRRRPMDGMYARLLDVPAALEARRYQTPGKLTLAVADSMGITPGTFELDGGPDGATCRRVSGPADVSLDVSTLAALYLGADQAGPLAAAGCISGEQDSIDLLAAMLRSRLAPNCPEMF